MWTIVGLTWREASRRRAFLITLLIMGAMFALSFVPRAFKDAFNMSESRYELGLSVTVLFGLDMIKFFSSVLAILLCAGAITSEIERGYLAVVLPKPVRRIEIYTGKWIGVMLFCFMNVVLWCALLWFSLWIQSGKQFNEMWRVLPQIMLYPLLYGTLALSLSTFALAALASMYTVAMGAFAYFSDHFVRPLAALFDVNLLQQVVRASEWILPMARLKRNIQEQLQGLIPAGMDGPPRFGSEEVLAFLKPEVTSFDMWFVVIYIAIWFVVGGVVFQRRDIQ